MSKVAIAGNASGTGTFTIAAPNSNTDRTLNLPDSAGTLLHDASSLPAANLTGDVAAARITGALNASGSAPIYACRAWVNFNGKNTVSINGSGNVSSITDNATGDYTVNFSNALPDAVYAAVGTCGHDDPNAASDMRILTLSSARTTSSCRVATSYQNGVGGYDVPTVHITIFR